MKVVHQIIEYLDGRGLLSDQLYDRLVALGWIKAVYLNGQVVTRSRFSAMLEASGNAPAADPGSDEVLRGEDVVEGGRSGGRGGKRGAVLVHRQSDREHEHERRRVIREISAALAQADIASSPELEGLRVLSGLLGASGPWPKSLLEASVDALDGALLGAMKSGSLRADTLLVSLGSEVCRFPLSDPRWSRYPAVLRAYEAVISGNDAASLQRTARGQAWILREKAIVTAHEVARAQQCALESLVRVTSRTPKTVERWLAASGMGPRKGPQAGDVHTVDLGDGVTLELVWIPKGTFLMGSPDGKGNDSEHPQHAVAIRRGFWLGKYPVTQAQWEAIMGNNPSYFKGDGRLPVESVSWEECQEYINKLNSKLEGSFRLPSEAEWEYACRAGTQTFFYWGDDPDDRMIGDYAWYRGNRGSSTHPVGGKLTNAWGLYDMSGNVYEWCEDDWHPWYKGVPNDGSAFKYLNQGWTCYRIARGGSSGGYPSECRSAYRCCGRADSNHLFDSCGHYRAVGFRVARTS